MPTSQPYDLNSDPAAQCHSIKQADYLQKIISNAETSKALIASLEYYIQSWHKVECPNPVSPPSIHRFISQDLSSIFLGNAPVIFQGTNNWAEKPYLPIDSYVSRLRILKGIAELIRACNPDRQIVAVIVPEKDYLISQILLLEDRFTVLEQAIAEFSQDLSSLDIQCIFNEPFMPLLGHGSIEDYAYPDSHLLGRDYIHIFYHILRALNIDNKDISSRITLERSIVFNDLSDKFDPRLPSLTNELCPVIASESCNLSDGHSNFCKPLGQTWQTIINNNQTSEQSLLLLGDSHSSIYTQKKLNYLLSNAFRQTRFEWNPFSVRQPTAQISSDIIILEISLRFAV